MARQTQADELRSVNPATLEEVGSVTVSPPEEVAETVTDARLAAQRWAESSFAERRALLVPGRAGRSRRSGRARSDGHCRDRQAARRVLHRRALRRAREHRLGGRQRGQRAAPRAPSLSTAPATQARLAALRAARRRRGDLAVELPARDPAHAGGLRGSGRERGRRQAVRADAALWWVGGGALPPSGRAEGARARRPGRGRRRARRSCARPASAKVVFTGSGAVGRQVAAAAGERLRPVTLELGGQGPDARLRGRRPRPRGLRRALGCVLELRTGVLGGRADLRRAAPAGGLRRGARAPRAHASARVAARSSRPSSGR